VVGASLASLKPNCVRKIAPPWPDVAIGVGRRCVPVALWIREHSGGKTKLVQIGRPRAPLSWFDLVITTPQYGLPEAPNVLHLPLPPVGNASAAAAEIRRWRDEFEGLPRPWIALLVGGRRWPFRFDADAAARLAREASATARRLGGSLLVSTSPRTGAAQVEALRRALDAAAYVHEWSAEADNPHHAVLQLADRFIVTGESVSMTAEACLTGKPVQIFAVPRIWQPRWSGNSGLGRLLAESGLLSPPRDAEAVQRLLVERGHASMLGGPAPSSHVPLADWRVAAAAAVRRLADA
jgi:mitochondrial fission protein ELM1